MNAIAVTGLEKFYGDLAAVGGIDLTVAEGEVFALLGPNGAGKSTTVEILEGHRRRTRGSVDVLGFDPETGGRSFRERIGIVLQQTALEPELEVGEILATYAAIYPRSLPVDEALPIAKQIAEALEAAHEQGIIVDQAVGNREFTLRTSPRHAGSRR